MATLKLTKLTVIGIIKGLKEVLELKLMTSAQMREMDRRAIEEYGIPSTLLMRNAARATAETAMELGGDRGRAAVFCGSGVYDHTRIQRQNFPDWKPREDD